MQDLIGDALHRGADADESGQQRLELPLHAGGHLHRPLTGFAQIETLPQHRNNMRNRWVTAAEIGRALDITAYLEPREIADLLDEHGRRRDRERPQRCGQQALGVVRVATREPHACDCPPAWTKRTVLCASQPSKMAVALRASNAGSTAASTIRLISPSSPSTWTPT